MKTRKLFIGLTRKPQIKGMSYEVFVSSVMIIAIIFLITRTLWVPLIIVPVMYLGRWLYKYDQHLIDILIKRIALCPPVKNRSLWNNSNSYDVAFPAKKNGNKNKREQ